jgi:hypothetical protein
MKVEIDDGRFDTVSRWCLGGQKYARKDPGPEWSAPRVSPFFLYCQHASITCQATPKFVYNSNTKLYREDLKKVKQNDAVK